MSRVVLDASAMLAFAFGEPGKDVVDGYLDGALASAVNVAEAGTRMVDRGASRAEAQRTIAHMSIEIVPFDGAQALAAVGLRDATRHRGLSLGDRACLQLAALRGVPAVTADRVWAQLDLGVEVQLIRD